VAFPVVSGSTPSNAATNTSHTINLDNAESAGDLLIAFVTCDVTSTMTYPGGWPTLKEADAFNSQAKIKAAYRICDGTEGASITVTFGTSQPMAARVLRITGWHGTTPPEASTGTDMGAASINPDPDNLTPSWGAADTLWLPALCHDSNGGIPTSYPASYTNGEDITNSTTNGFSVCRRELNATSEDPAAYTITNSQECFVFTVGVRPSAEEPPPGDTVQQSPVQGARW
jgi:hypothetical protein